jgi:ParB/RepB/Spo0J family partition protein
MGSWALSDVPPAVRALAEEAAARSGLPVGEWLARAIRDRRAREGPDPSSIAKAAPTPDATVATAAIAVEDATTSAPSPIPDLPWVFGRFLPSAAVAVREVSPDAVHVSRIQGDIEALQGNGLRVDTTAGEGAEDAVIVRPDPEDADAYEIVAGHAAWKAAAKGRDTKLSAVVVDLSDLDVTKLSLLGFLRAGTSSPIAEAEALRWLLRRGGLNEDDLMEAFGTDRSTIRRRLALLSLPDPVIERIDDGVLDIEHASHLLESVFAEPVSRMVIAHRLSAGEVKKVVGLTNGLPDRPPEEIDRIGEQLAAILNAKVVITRTLDGTRFVLRLRPPKRKTVVYRLQPETPKEAP